MKTMYSKGAIYYDELNRDLQVADLAFYDELVPDGVENLCEIACGTGRILLHLHSKARTLVGIDISEEMLALAKQKSAARAIQAMWILADMRKLPDMAPVDIMICGYNSFQHLIDKEDARLFLLQAHDRLADNGMLIIDVFNPCKDFLFPAGNRRMLASFLDSNGKKMDIIEETIYHLEEQINDITYYYYIDGIFSFSEFYRMKQYIPAVLDSLIEESGFDIVRKYGDYNMNVFHESSLKQIFMLVKHEKLRRT